MPNSRATTVATPAKWPGRALPHRPRATGPGSIEVAKPGGYISSTDGANMKSMPMSLARAASSDSVRG